LLQLVREPKTVSTPRHPQRMKTSAKPGGGGLLRDDVSAMRSPFVVQ
jgi:hypothetical protein